MSESTQDKTNQSTNDDPDASTEGTRKLTRDLRARLKESYGVIAALREEIERLRGDAVQSLDVHRGLDLTLREERVRADAAQRELDALKTGRIEPLLDPTELAKLFRVSEQTLANWRLRGRGPAFLKMGILVRYRSEDVREWLAAGVMESTADPAHPIRQIEETTRRMTEGH